MPFRRHGSFSNLALVIVIILIAFAIYYPFSPAGVQSRNMAKARAHIPVIQRALGSDPRFANISLHDYTANDGCLIVNGNVLAGSDLDQLKKIIASTSPPTDVVYVVLVEDEIQTPQITTSP
jgi:hypothetical protein